LISGSLLQKPEPSHPKSCFYYINHMKRAHIVLLCLIFLFCPSAYGQHLTVQEIMAEPSIAGMRPEGEKLSPDGSKVIYLWNAEGKMPRDLYLVSTSGGTPQKILSVSDLPVPSRTPEKENKLDYGLTVRDDFVKARENQLGNFEWSPDSKRLVFSYGGDLYVYLPDSGKPQRLTQTQAAEVGPRFLDNDRILYSQNGNLFVWNLANNLVIQISKEADAQKFISVANPTPNKAGSLVAYVESDNSKQRALVVPNYLGEFVTASGPRRGWSDQKVLVTVTDGSRDTPFEIKLPKPEGVSNFRRLAWAADGRSLVVDRVDKDTKRRQLFYVHNVGSKDEQIILVTEETDDKWQAPLSSIVEPNPKDASQLFFGSERDGFNHLYLAKLEAEMRAATSVPAGGEQVATSSDPAHLTGKVSITQLTKGNWQEEWAKWVDGKKIIYASTQPPFTRSLPQTPQPVGYLERQLHLMTSDGFTINPPSYRPGMRIGFQMSEDMLEPIILFEGSAWNEPDELFAERILNPDNGSIPGFGGIHQLTNTTPKSFVSRQWIAPKFLEIAARDNKKIPAKIYLPTGFVKTKKYPMVIFVHGAGYLQNVINGWNNYYREFMFNELLTQKGYVVLDIDYRGSAGYGREWRTDVYDFLGGKDMDDHIDAIDFMVNNYGVNQSKIGVYGGSYGGFMAEMLAMRAPEKIAAAAALRPVADWKNYYASSPGYTTQRLGFPDKNPEGYKRSSPISYADKLERPLLILHGESDDNVHVQDSMQLVEKLVRLGKTQYFDVMFYPSENHGFVRPESWTDEYERILGFFEKHLK
jgi:dipeptidyl aminopeptidase/acylaminoacyl peptidase